MFNNDQDNRTIDVIDDFVFLDPINNNDDMEYDYTYGLDDSLD